MLDEGYFKIQVCQKSHWIEINITVQRLMPVGLLVAQFIIREILCKMKCSSGSQINLEFTRSTSQFTYIFITFTMNS